MVLVVCVIRIEIGQNLIGEGIGITLLPVIKEGTMNNNIRNEFASYGLEILKRSVLLVLYEDTYVAYVGLTQ